ncbi:hypothetical protein B7R22_12005 [Subtercola boreus]|uniref:Antitoxin n=1 Tax=Subtercola boreus TaxID=120213 RepID=A0A3E0VW41_9MICO|nr:type II toxin-antitoxin system prevent-host-death family antitoxin [Subtercola boreus]RFA13805.1 hypothetical protein B7R22_12005 [Subtercola boreus]
MEKVITSAQLRQNPSEALRDVQNGDEYHVTYHGRDIARLIPPERPRGATREQAMSLYATPVDSGWADELEDLRAGENMDDSWR